MIRQVALAATAKADLLEIWRYTSSNWSEAKAEQYLQRLWQTFTLLASHPDIARLRHEITPAVRLHPHRSHLLIYIETETHLNILRVVHARAHWQAVLTD